MHAKSVQVQWPHVRSMGHGRKNLHIWNGHARLPGKSAPPLPAVAKNVRYDTGRALGTPHSLILLAQPSLSEFCGVVLPQHLIPDLFIPGVFLTLSEVDDW